MHLYVLIKSPEWTGVSIKIKTSSMVKKIIASLLAVLMFSWNIYAAPLERGTVLTVRITSPISSKSDGNAPSALVENDVKDKNGVVLIKRGTPVQLQVERKKAKGVGKGGYVIAKCVSTTAVDGQTITLEGSVDSEGDNKKGLAIGLGVGLGLTLLPFVGFAFLAIKGEQATIANNTLIPSVFVMNDYNVAE